MNKKLSLVMNRDREPLSIAGLLCLARVWAPRSRDPGAEFVGEERDLEHTVKTQAQ